MEDKSVLNYCEEIFRLIVEQLILSLICLLEIKYILCEYV